MRARPPAAPAPGAAPPPLLRGHPPRSCGIIFRGAEDLLLEDLARFEEGVGRLVEVPLNENQFAALVSFAFNLGLGALGESTLLRLLNEGGYDGAAGEIGRWVFADGQRLEGLARRGEAERRMFGSPV